MVGVDRARPAVYEEARIETVGRGARVPVQPRRGACVAFDVDAAAVEGEVHGAAVGLALRSELRLAVERAPAQRAGERGDGQRRIEAAAVERASARGDGAVDVAVPAGGEVARVEAVERSEEHTSELQSLMRISSAVFFLKKKNI